MRYRELIEEAAIPAISPQQANGMFGPLYHGTQHDMNEIVAKGFNVAKSVPFAVGGWRSKPVGTSNGYSLESYGYTGISAPVHHLGFGAYFTTKKAIAKRFAGDTVKGMRTFCLDSDRVLTINFGAPNTMLRWWLQNGYDMTREATEKRDVATWIAATKKLTDRLKADYDAVWFTGKGYRGSLLDGDQVCVYDPSLIRVIEPKLATGLQIGAKVVHSQIMPERFRGSNVFYIDDVKLDDFGSIGRLVGWRGVYRADADSDRPRYPIHLIPPSNVVGLVTPTQTKDGRFLSVKWSKGGEQFNYDPAELTPVTK